MNRRGRSTTDPQALTETDFVRRWSRLKHESNQLANVAATGDGSSEDTTDQSENVQNTVTEPARMLTDEDMPDIQSLTADSDFSGFLSPGVSEKLRKLALRKLFRSEVFNIRDGLDEYDGDYTHFEKLGGIITADMQHQLEMEAERKARNLLQDETRLIDGGVPAEHDREEHDQRCNVNDPDSSHLCIEPDADMNNVAAASTTLMDPVGNEDGGMEAITTQASRIANDDRLEGGADRSFEKQTAQAGMEPENIANSTGRKRDRRNAGHD